MMMIISGLANLIFGPLSRYTGIKRELDPRRDGSFEATLVGESSGSGAGRALATVALIVMMGADFANFKSTIDFALGGVSPWIAYFIASSATLAAGLLPHQLGMRLRRYSDRFADVGRFEIAILSFAWLSLLVCVFLLRSLSGKPGLGTADSGELGGSDGGIESVNSGAMNGLGASSVLVALFLTGILLATAVLAYSMGWVHNDPFEKDYRRAERCRVHAFQSLAQVRGLIAEYEQAVNSAKRGIEDDEREYEAARQMVSHIGDGYRELVRVKIAGALGDPAATNALTDGERDRPTPVPTAEME